VALLIAGLNLQEEVPLSSAVQGRRVEVEREDREMLRMKGEAFQLALVQALF
jgi:hypothetical protein